MSGRDIPQGFPLPTLNALFPYIFRSFPRTGRFSDAGEDCFQSDVTFFSPFLFFSRNVYGIFIVRYSGRRYLCNCACFFLFGFPVSSDWRSSTTVKEYDALFALVFLSVYSRYKFFVTFLPRAFFRNSPGENQASLLPVFVSSPSILNGPSRDPPPEGAGRFTCCRCICSFCYFPPHTPVLPISGRWAQVVFGSQQWNLPPCGRRSRVKTLAGDFFPLP